MYDEGWSVKNKFWNVLLPLVERRCSCISIRYIQKWEINFVSRDTHVVCFICFTWKIDHEQRTLCTHFSGGQAGAGAPVSTNERKHRVIRNNEDKSFVRVGSSSSKYLFYLQLGAPLLPAPCAEIPVMMPVYWRDLHMYWTSLPLPGTSHF